jgi:hypothetical protein
MSYDVLGKEVYMARVAWNFASYEWPVNPEPGGDTGWVPGELVMSEMVPIDVYQSSIQIGGQKSARRRIRGWIWGTDSTTFYSKFREWYNNGIDASLTDHLGETRIARLIRFEAEAINDAQAWKAGRQTWKYTAEFIETT